MDQTQHSPTIPQPPLVTPPPPAQPAPSVPTSQPTSPLPPTKLSQPIQPPQPSPVPPLNLSPSNLPPQPLRENPTINSQTPNYSSSRSGITKYLIVAAIVILLSGFGYFAYSYFFGSQLNQNTNTGGRGASSNQSVTLVYWGLWEPSNVLQSVFEEFKSQTNITVEYIQHSPRDYRERLQSALAKGDGPDIFRFHNTWVPMFKKELDTLPTNILSPTEYQQTFYPVFYTDLNSSSGIVGIPLMIDGLGLYYNKKIFDTAGKTPPTTWDELRSLASQLTIRNKNEIERAGIALGLTSNVDNFSDIVGLMLLQNGANPANPTNSKAQHALTFFEIFTTTDGVWNDRLPASTYAFATEKVAMIIAPSWRAHEIAQINPDIDFAISPLPQLPSSDVSWASYWVEGVSQKSANKQAAWQLLKFLSSKEVMRQMYTNASQERLFGEPFSRVDMQDQLIGDPYVGAYIQQAANAVSWPMASRTFDNGLNDGIIKAYEDALNSSSGDAALQQTANEINRILTLYGVNPNQLTSP